MRVGFLYNAQIHQILHSLPIAFELSAMQGVQVDVLAPTGAHLGFVDRLARLYPSQRTRTVLLDRPWWLRLADRARGASLPPKLLTLIANRSRLDGYDALVVPERSSTVIRKLGVTRPWLIHTSHGAGDRDVTTDDRIRLFDFCLVAGAKAEGWLLQRGLIRPGAYAVGAYTKFDIVRRMGARREPLFPDGKPVILYNPHFEGRLSSWPGWGFQILDRLAAQDRWNVVFAPHIRLFDTGDKDRAAPFRRYMDLPHMRVDLGSDRSVDMTYTMSADLYLGDVSSQVYEFLLQPRPCVFLNAHGVDWRGDERYGFWELGPVVDRVADLLPAIEGAFASHGAFVDQQKAAVARSFDLSIEEPARFAAEAVHGFLARAGHRRAGG